MNVKGATFLVQHFLQKDANGWPRVIDIYRDDATGEFRFLPKTHRIRLEDGGTTSMKSLPAAVTSAEFRQAQRTAVLYARQVLKTDHAPWAGGRRAR